MNWFGLSGWTSYLWSQCCGIMDSLSRHESKTPGTEGLGVWVPGTPEGTDHWNRVHTDIRVSVVQDLSLRVVQLEV